jgi:DUF2924 family protein
MNMGRQISALQHLSVQQLRAKFAELFGASTNAHNRDWLLKRVAWRLQSLEEGDLSERAKRRADELANDADLRVVPPRERAAPADMPALVRAPASDSRAPASDSRVPAPGTVIIRPYKGDILNVKVLGDGFEFDGRTYRSLSAVAKAVTGSHCNGFAFFRLAAKGATT